LAVLDLNNIAKNCVEYLNDTARKKGISLLYYGVDAPLFFKGGKQVDSVLGAVPESMLQPKVNALL